MARVEAPVLTAGELEQALKEAQKKKQKRSPIEARAQGLNSVISTYRQIFEKRKFFVVVGRPEVRENKGVKSTSIKFLMFLIPISTALLFTGGAVWAAHSDEGDGVGPGFSAVASGLEDAVLADFVADLRAKTVKGLQDVAIRASSTSRIELRVAEVIMANTSARVIHCLACREGSPNLKRIARISGIRNFLEIEYDETPAHQTLHLTVTRAKDFKKVWEKTYIHDAEESRETRVWIVQDRRVSVFGDAMAISKRTNGLMGAFGLGLRAQTSGWGLELGAARTTESSTAFRILAVKIWDLQSRPDDLWIGTGASALTASDSFGDSSWGWIVRAGYDWRFSRQWLAGLWMGDCPTSPAAGFQIGGRIGFVF